jgi:hypothetical protein
MTILIGTHRAFDLDVFHTKIAAVNKHLSRFSQSALDPLLRELAKAASRLGARLDLEALQELVFYIPYSSQLKYREALSYLAAMTGIVICGRPTEPNMALAYFRANEYLYVGEVDGRDVLNRGYMDSSGTRAPTVRSYHHVFDLTFKSTTGNMASLSKVGTREHVKFRTEPGEAPFNESMADTPREFFHGESLSGADTGMGRDDHFTKPPSLVCREPWEEGSLWADQWYQYTVDNGKTWANIPGAAYNLIKGVRKDRQGRWVFYFIKQNWEPHNKKAFRFEVEYLLHSPFPRPKPNTKLGKADSGTGKADLREHASAIIRMR